MTGLLTWPFVRMKVLALPLRERQALQSALDKIASAAGTGMAALVSEGWYMAGTTEWWMMTSNELLLLQQIATFTPEVRMRWIFQPGDKAHTTRGCRFP